MVFTAISHMLNRILAPILKVLLLVSPSHILLFFPSAACMRLMVIFSPVALSTGRRRLRCWRGSILYLHSYYTHIFTENTAGIWFEIPEVVMGIDTVILLITWLMILILPCSISQLRIWKCEKIGILWHFPFFNLVENSREPDKHLFSLVMISWKKLVSFLCCQSQLLLPSNQLK